MTVKRFGVFFFFLVLVLVIYSPLINKSFASDDFAVLRRVVFDRHGIFIKNFFRPLSDITLYSNYLVAGFNPVVYNLFNFISHACIVYMVFLVAGRVAWIPAERRRFFSWVSALLFLSYPFHNESVAWGVGRASLMAALFGTIAMLAAVSAINIRLKYFLVCLFYFIGLSGYESILVLPGIILLLLYDRRQSWRSYVPWVAWMGITLIIHLVVRVLVSGTLWGTYGADMMANPGKTNIILKYVKVAGRILLPPMENSELLVVLCVVLTLALAAVVVLLWKRRRDAPGSINGLLRFGAMLLLAMLIPFMFGISTRTYEGDRLFYFPSVFLALGLGWMITVLPGKRQTWVAGVILVYQLVFLFINIHNWYEASDITKNILGVLKEVSSGKEHIYVVNIPEEYEGAHVLRNGFYDALWLEGVDTSKITAVNYLRTEQRRSSGSLEPVRKANGMTVIPPFVTILPIDSEPGELIKTGDKFYTLRLNRATERVLCCNNRNPVLLP